MMEDFHFLRPAWLLLLPLLLLLLWQFGRRKLKSDAWEGLCDPQLLPHILESAPQRHLRHRPAPLLGALAGALAILALAGPVWERLPQPTFSSQSALVLALDLSLSMTVQDIKPSRLERARHKIADILKRRREGETALIVYAADAFVVTPLTNDGSTIRAQLAALEPNLMPAQGSRSGAPLKLAMELLEQTRTKNAGILLITDAADLDAESTSAALALKKAGHRLSILGVGTPEGGPIPAPRGGFMKDRRGAIVIPKLDEAALEQLAGDGGGNYARLRADDRDLDRLLTGLVQSPLELSSEMEARLQMADNWREEGVWLLPPLLLLGAFVFRRGALFLLPFLMLLTPTTAEALEWPESWKLDLEHLWQRPDQKGMQALEQGDPRQAAENFQNPAWKSAAHYRAGEHEAALKSLEGMEDALSHYNRGNALARLGRYQEALKAYDEALTQQPDHADAKHNREVVRKAIPPPPEQEKRKQEQTSEQEKQEGDNQEPSEGGEGERDQENDDQQDQKGETGEDQQSASSEQEQGEEQKASQEQEKEEQQDQQQQDTRTQKEKEQQDQQQQAQEGKEAQENERQSSPDQGQEQSGMEEAYQPEPTRDEPSGEDGEPPAPGPFDQKDAQQRSRESRMATEQWLRRIPDDPGGLLRRKFRYQYRMHRDHPNRGLKPW